MTQGAMTCPRCQGTMTGFARAGVQVDQCESCRGIFLDRGELERLVEAESQYYSPQAATPTYPPAGYPATGPAPGDDPRYGDHRDSRYRDHHDGNYGGHGGPGRGRRRNFFEELFGD